MTYAQIEALPYRYIVWTAATGDQPAGPNLAETEALATHLRRPGASVPATWKGAEIVTHTEALRRVATAEGDLYDAWTRALMPGDEASAWTNPELLYAAHWGVATNPPEWQAGRWLNADALLFDTQHKYPGVAKLLAAFGRQPESVRAGAKERATTAKAPPSHTGEVFVRDVFDHIRLRDFLRD